MANGFSTSMVPQSVMVTSFRGLSLLSVFVFSTFLTTSWGAERRKGRAAPGTGRAGWAHASRRRRCLHPAQPPLTMPSSTLPNTTCLPSSHGVFTVVMKNWEPLVSLPALAMLTQPGP